MNNSSKLKKVSVTIATIILLLIIIISICIVLYSNKLLPKGLHEYLSSIIEKDEIKVSEEKNTEEIPFYEVEFELDLPKYKDIEIQNLANNETMLFGNFSQRTIDDISIIKADGKYGLISNQDGKILLEPTYDYFMKDMHTGDKFESDLESIYGIKGEQYDIISLITFKTKKNVDVTGHGGGSYNYYDEKKDVICSQEYEDIVEYKKDDLIINKYSELGTKFAFCIAKEENEVSNQTKPLYGYFNCENGEILIKPEFEKASIFQNGVAGVKKDGKAYYISESNIKISDDYFEDVTGVYNFKSWIKQDGKWKLAKFPKLEERAKYYKEKKTNKDDKLQETNNVENMNSTNNTNNTNTINVTNTSNITNTTNNTNTVNNNRKRNNTVKNEGN